MLKNKADNILDSSDRSKSQKSKTPLVNNNESVTIDTSCITNFTVDQLLDMARLRWNTNFVKGDWQLYTINDENEKEIIASCFTQGYRFNDQHGAYLLRTLLVFSDVIRGIFFYTIRNKFIV